jgi:hypothetical protein
MQKVLVMLIFSSSQGTYKKCVCVQGENNEEL